MSDLRASHRAILRAAVAVLLGGMLAAIAVAPAEAASTSLGSVPAEVSAYVATGGMVARLNDVYGKNAAHAGIDFDATTKAGPISRVYEWTAQRLSNLATDHPVQLTNNWVVPITIADKPVGVATVWINPQTVAPELASFDPTPGLATALEGVPATAALVRDTAAHSWLALDAGTVTPLITGTSGLSTPVPVASLKLSATAAPAAQRQPVAGLVLVIIGVAALVVVLMVALLLPRGRSVRNGSLRNRMGRDAAAPAVVGAGSAPAEPEPTPPSPATHPASAARAVSPAKSGAAAKSSTPVTKPTSSKPGGSKPGGGTPASGSASTKPRTQKPPAQKPPAQKPPTQKPPTQKPPAQKRPARRPDPDPDSTPDPTPDA